MAGVLYLISTPIGNLDDITFRAVETLKSVDLIASEDTRQTKKLLSRYEIETPLSSYHDHSSEKKKEALIERLERSESIALVSDAGTPLINDPGFKLVRAAIDAGIDVTAVPGPSSITNALILSGLPTDQFCYVGYLPQKSGKRKKVFEKRRDFDGTLLFLESPYRILKALGDLVEVLGDREVAICREMTKKFEEIFRGFASEAITHFSKKAIKGEFTVVVRGNTE